VICGHVHRAITATIAGRPVFVCPSTNIQLALDLGDPGAGHIMLVREPPAFAVHDLVGGDVVSHLQPIGDFGPTFAA
jgi:hypothetical protein